MKKTISLLGIFLIMVIPIVMSSNEFGKITSGGNLIITDVDVKVDSLTSRNLDYGDEISRIAEPSSIVIFQIEVKNNHATLDMEEVEMVVTIDDLDLEETTSQTDLNDNQDKTLSVTFTLPSDAEERDYEVFIEVEGELNNITHKVEYDLDLVVEVEDTASQTSTPDSCIDRINSLNNTISDINQNIDSYFEPYSQCVVDRKNLEGKIETKDAVITSKQGYETKFTLCNTELIICNSDRAYKSAANESCHRAIVNEYLPKIKSQQNTTFLVAIIIAVGALIFREYEKRKEKQGTETEEETTDGEEST